MRQIKDSGKREEFATGSRRDTREGKGRFDLLPPFAIADILIDCPNFNSEITNDPGGVAFRHLKDAQNCAFQFLGVHGSIGEFSVSVLVECCIKLLLASENLTNESEGCKGADLIRAPDNEGGFTLPQIGLERLAQHFECGAAKYGDRNWENGQPLSRYFDSGSRHICKALQRMEDEDHVIAAAWNFACLIDTMRRIECGFLPPELDDLPKLGKLLESKLEEEQTTEPKTNS